MVAAGQRVDCRKNRLEHEANTRKAEETPVKRKINESINEAVLGRL